MVFNECHKQGPILFLAALGSLAALFAGCGGGGSAGAAGRGGSGIPVSTAAAKRGNIDVYLDSIGTATPVYTATVTSRVAGQITEVDYKEGQAVKKGDLLAIVDPRPYDAALLQAQGQLARDQATLKNDRINLDRYSGAYKEHAIPEQQYATAQATVDADEGVVKLDHGSVDAAQVNVDYTRITSPIDGRVGLRLVDPGNIVQANGTVPIAVVAQIQPITVIFPIAEDHLDAVAKEMNGSAPIRVLALDRSQSAQLAEGTLITIDNQIDTTTGTVRARAQFDNAKNELFPNQFVNARLLLRTLTDAIVVPTAAVQLNDTQNFVYVVKPDGTVQSRNIKVVATEGESTSVTGVEPGENLITDGFDRLQNGIKVTIRQPEAAPARTGGGT